MDSSSTTGKLILQVRIQNDAGTGFIGLIANACHKNLILRLSPRSSERFIPNLSKHWRDGAPLIEEDGVALTAKPFGNIAADASVVQTAKGDSSTADPILETNHR